MSTLGDTKSTPGVYHDECERYHKFSGGVQYTVEFHKYTGGIPRCTWVVIMSTPGVFSTLGDTMSTPGDFDTNEKKPLLNFCSRTF